MRTEGFVLHHDVGNKIFFEGVSSIYNREEKDKSGERAVRNHSAPAHKLKGKKGKADSRKNPLLYELLPYVYIVR